MAKVTEQDLIDRGFNWVHSTPYYNKTYHGHKLFRQIIISTDMVTLLMRAANINIGKPLTTENLDLFIRFAKGEKLN